MDIDWVTKIITVYKTDTFMSLVSGVVYDMNTNDFRLAVMAEEDNEEGMVWLNVFNHNTTVTLGGVEYARLIEIINGYTVTFDDTGGGWVCNLIGSNNNILDVTNLTSVQVRSNNSAGLVALTDIYNSAEATKRLVEGLRPHHTGTGNVWYWDPYGGADTNAGNDPDRAVKTFAQAHTYAVDNNHDIIICMAGDPTGKTTTTENISITKNFLFIRGPGRDFEINSADDNQNAITITSNGVEVSGMQVSTSATNTKWAIHTTGDFTLLKDMWVYGAVDGVHFENGEYGIANNVKMHHNDGVGLKFSGTCDHVDIVDCHIGSNALDNVVIDVDASTHEVNFMGDTVIHSSVGGYGVNISATTKSVIIHSSVEIFNNSSGDINDLSTNTYHSDKVAQIHKMIKNRIETDPVTGVMTVYDDDDATVLFTANVWENVAGTTAYSGNAINRKDKFG